MTEFTREQIAAWLKSAHAESGRRCFEHCGLPGCECDEASEAQTAAEVALISNREALARQLLAAMDALADADMAQAALVERAAEGFENDTNLRVRICCNGQDCGCQGATADTYVAWQLRALAPDAGVKALEALRADVKGWAENATEAWRLFRDAETDRDRLAAELAEVRVENERLQTTLAALSPPPEFEEGASIGYTQAVADMQALRARVQSLSQQVDTISAHRDELDFLLHEGGEDSVANLIADNSRLAAELAEARKQVEALRASPFPDETGFYGLVGDALREAEKAMSKFPQPNYVISKVAEEAGEVVKAAIHCAEKRETAENLRGEMKQLIAMLYRLWVEGDGVHGLPSVRAATEGGNDGL